MTDEEKRAALRRRYTEEMDRTRHTTLTPDEILRVIEWHLDRLSADDEGKTEEEQGDDFTAFHALMTVRLAITSGMGFDALMAELGR